MKEFWLMLAVLLAGTVFANWFFSLSESAEALADLALIVLE